MLQFVAHILVGRAQAETVSLCNEGLPLDQHLCRLRCEIRQQHGGLSPTTRELLSHHLPGLTLNFLAGDIGPGDLGQNAAARCATKEISATEPWHQCDYHK